MRKMNKYVLFSLIIAVGVALDQITKYIAKDTLMGQPTESYLGGFFRLTFVEMQSVQTDHLDQVRRGECGGHKGPVRLARRETEFGFVSHFRHCTIRRSPPFVHSFRECPVGFIGTGRH